MRRTDRIGACLMALCLAAVPARPQAGPPDPILGAMAAELERTLDKLAGEPDPPYFLSYEITERHTAVVRGSFSALESSSEGRTRQLDIDLRVGDYQLDNTRQLRGRFGRSDRADRYDYIAMPVDDDPDAIRAVLWKETDDRYKRARERLTRVRTNVQVAVEQEDASADFAREPEVGILEEPVSLAADVASWRERVRRLSAPFAAHGEIYQGRAVLFGTVQTRWYVNSDGSRVRVSEPGYRLVISGRTKADDGMELPLYRSFFARTPDALPDDETVLTEVRQMVDRLVALRTAPVVDPFTGPAILSGRASGVFFHEVFGHRIEGHRLKDETDSQTFKKLLGERVLPPEFSVYFDPTLESRAGATLAGHYAVDNEGARARRVPVIEQGVFKSFLMSRDPIEGFPSSNGHGRREAGYPPVARQSNLVVEVADPLEPEELTRRLLEEVERQGKPYGLRFDAVQGGFTLTGRNTPNAFNVNPLLVYRVYPDGREELVRGVDLIGTPLTAFSKIVAGDDSVTVFNGTCGAESGGVPVSASAPRVLISEIEVQKKAKSQDRPPILPVPPAERSEEEGKDE